MLIADFSNGSVLELHAGNGHFFDQVITNSRSEQITGWPMLELKNERAKAPKLQPMSLCCVFRLIAFTIGCMRAGANYSDQMEVDELEPRSKNKWWQQASSRCRSPPYCVLSNPPRSCLITDQAGSRQAGIHLQVRSQNSMEPWSDGRIIQRSRVRMKPGSNFWYGNET